MDENEDIEKFTYNEEDKSKWKNNCRPDIGLAIPEEQREKLADSFGPNWASIISGCGDQ